MRCITPDMHARRYVILRVAGASLIALAGVFWTDAGLTAQDGARNGTPSVPYANMPASAPIVVRVGKYLDVPDFAKWPDVDPAKGYRTQNVGAGLHMITDGSCQSQESGGTLRCRSLFDHA